MNNNTVIELIEMKLKSLREIQREKEFYLQASASIYQLEWVLGLLKQESEYAN